MSKRTGRRHHNNKGYEQIKNGSTKVFIKNLAKKLNIKYKEI